MADFIVNIASQGSEKVQADLNKILSSANATSGSIAALSRTLNTSANSAAAFANKLGLSASQSNSAIARYRELKSAGASNINIYKALNNELGFSATQYKQLVVSLKEVDRQTDIYVQSLKEQQEAQDKANKEAAESQQASAAQILALQQVQQFAQKAATALGQTVGRATSEFISYDDALTSVSAKSGLAKDQLGFLEEAARQVALTTSQSPSSAIRAADSLIALGASAEDASERLATTAQLADALRTVGATIEQSAKVVQLGVGTFEKFGITAEQVGNKVALLSDTTAAASTTGLDEFLQLFSKAGGLSAQLGMSIDELLAAFGELRDAGQAPEVAATALKGLLSTSLASRKKLEELGLTVFEVGESGKEEFVGLASLMQQIADRSLSTTQIVEIFGKTGVAAAVALSEGYQDVNARIEQLGGTTTELADKSAAINSSIQGQITLLQGSIQTAFVEIGRSVGQFTGPAVNFTTQLVNAFIAAPPAIKQVAGALLGVGAAISSATVAVIGYALAFKAFQAADVIKTLKDSGRAFLEIANSALISKAATQANTVATKLASLATKEYTVQMGVNALAEKGRALASRIGVMATKAKVAVTNLAIGATIKETLTTAASTIATKAKSLATKISAVVTGQYTIAELRAAAANKASAVSKQFNAAATKTLATSVGRLTVLLGGLAAAGLTALALTKVFNAITGEARKTRQATNELSDAIDGYSLSVGQSLPKQKTFLDSFVGVLGNVQNALKRFPILGAAVDRYTQSLLRAKAVQEGIAFNELSQEASRTTQAFEDLRTTNQLGTAQAADLLPILEQQLAALQAVNEVGADESVINTKRITIKQTREQIAAIKAAQGAQEQANAEAIEGTVELSDALQGTIGSYNELTSALESVTADKVRQVNEDLKLSADDREAAIAQVEAQSAKDRIAILEGLIAERQALSGLSEEDEKKRVEELAKFESEIADIRLKASEKEAKRRDEIEKARIEKEKALRQAALDKDLENIETLKQAEELRVQASTNYRKQLLENLDDESDAIKAQIDLLQVQQSIRQSIYDDQVKQIDDEISSLESVRSLVKQIEEGELNQSQALLVQSRLRALGLSDKATEKDLVDEITRKEEEKYRAEMQALDVRQWGEMEIFELQKAQQKIELERQGIQAEMAAIEAQSLAIQAQMTLEADRRLLAFKEQELLAAKREGAAESELIAIRSDIESQKAKIALGEAQIPLLEQTSDLAWQQAEDVERAKAESEKLTMAEKEQLQQQMRFDYENARSQGEQERFTRNLQRAEQGLDPFATGAKPRSRTGIGAGGYWNDFDKQNIGLPTPLPQQFGARPLSAQGNVIDLGTAASQRMTGETAVAGVQMVGMSLQQIAPTINGIAQAVSQIANRPVPVVNANTTFVNEPSPISAMVAVQQGQLQAARGL
jgi:TP901 family phage tail tape measure protein